MFDRDIEMKFVQHCLDNYPNEACGVMAKMEDGSVDFVPFKNVHENPKMNFRMNGPDFKEYYEGGRVLAIMHSHTANANNYPSLMDMVQQDNMQIPWGIVHINEHRDIDGPFYFGDQIPIIDFKNRPWRDNVYDCFTLLRDVYRVEEKVTLPVFPREGEWWKANKNLLEENFEKAGFVQIDESQLKKNCAILCRVNAPMGNPVANHIIIVRERGLVLHHLKDRLSRTDPYNQWRSTAVKYLKYAGPR